MSSVFDSTYTRIIDALKNQRNVFLTGPAGVGKSYLIKKLTQKFVNKCVILCPTGKAASCVEGLTIHSFFKYDFFDLVPKQVDAYWEKFFSVPLYNREKSYAKTNLFGEKNEPTGRITWGIFDYYHEIYSDIALRRKNGNKLLVHWSSILQKLYKFEYIFIDEISMVDKKLFDIFIRIILCLQKILEKEGLPKTKIIITGDFFQLPPAVDKPDYAFESAYWNVLNFANFILDVNYRQSEDKTFEKFLNTIRCGEIDSPLALDVINQLNTSHLCHRIEQKYTYISATNNDCDRINQRFIQEIASPEIVFSAKYFDRYNNNSSNKGFEFIHKQLLMKIGMKILFNKNVYEKSTPLFLNGESGEIVDINIAGNFCKVRKENGKIINVGYQQWAIYQFNERNNQLEIIKSVEQIPIIPAYAITYHKSQGMTMTKEVCINPNLYGFKKISGMIYTAFSRVNSLKNLYLSYPINLSVISADPRVIEFYKRLIN